MAWSRWLVVGECWYGNGQGELESRSHGEEWVCWVEGGRENMGHISGSCFPSQFHVYFSLWNVQGCMASDWAPFASLGITGLTFFNCKTGAREVKRERLPATSWSRGSPWPWLAFSLLLESSPFVSYTGYGVLVVLNGRNGKVGLLFSSRAQKLKKFFFSNHVL